MILGGGSMMLFTMIMLRNLLCISYETLWQVKVYASVHLFILF